MKWKKGIGIQLVGALFVCTVDKYGEKVRNVYVVTNKLL